MSANTEVTLVLPTAEVIAQYDKEYDKLQLGFDVRDLLEAYIFSFHQFNTQRFVMHTGKRLPKSVVMGEILQWFNVNERLVDQKQKDKKKIISFLENSVLSVDDYITEMLERNFPLNEIEIALTFDRWSGDDIVVNIQKQG